MNRDCNTNGPNFDITGRYLEAPITIYTLAIHSNNKGIRKGVGQNVVWNHNR